MKKINKLIAVFLAVTMLFICVPVSKHYAAGLADYTTAIEMEFNKLYTISVPSWDKNAGEVSYLWYKFTPKTKEETKIRIKKSSLSVGDNFTEIIVYDSLLQEVDISLNQNYYTELKKNTTYYVRMHARNGTVNISFTLQTISMTNADSSNGENSGSNTSDQIPGNSTDTKPGADSSNNDTKPGSGSNNNGEANSSDSGDINSDFWNEENNGSEVYSNELPVPEITEVENGSRRVNISWSCDDVENIDGYYIYRSKDGKSWDKIATIKDTEVKDYEDLDIANGDACGYIVCTYSGEEKSENSVPEYTYFLKKVTIKSVKSNASKKLNVKWNNNLNSTGYQIRVSTTKSFTRTTTNSTRVDSKTTSSKTIGKLKGGKKYYVQVRAYRNYNGEVYYSEWTSTKSVKVKN